ncbi:hypothetical protein IW146_000085 [Coemansia sp. RSA 922]|nr:hypothetical protein GGI08_008681 [Coemansia sp. S2]KAJ2118234.1 hypothetical protein IW146_000085 [Coemansia sp. RSA 922]
MDIWPLSPKKEVLLVSICNKIVGECSSKPNYISFHQSLPVTGKELLATARDKFDYKGASARLVKTVFTGNLEAKSVPVQRSFVFDNEQYEDKSITLFLTTKCSPPHKNRKAIERKAQHAAETTSEVSEESDDYGELPENIEIPFYNPSRKAAKIVDELAHPDEALK